MDLLPPVNKAPHIHQHHLTGNLVSPSEADRGTTKTLNRTDTQLYHFIAWATWSSFVLVSRDQMPPSSFQVPPAGYQLPCTTHHVSDTRH